MMVCDTNALYIAYDRSEPRHAEVVAALRSEREQRLVSPFILAELDYLVMTRLGIHVEDKLLADVADGVYELATMTSRDVAKAREVAMKYRDLRVGLADASNVVLGAGYDTNRILTFDDHFRAMRPLTKHPAFALLPTDEQKALSWP